MERTAMVGSGVRRRGSRGGWRGLATFAALALVAVGCGGAGAGDEAAPATTAMASPAAGGSVRWGLAAETSSGFDPTTGQWSDPGYQVAEAVFDPLMKLDADYKPQPFLAESVTADPTSTTWTIVLRPDVAFHDGTPLDAEALVANLEAHRASFLTGQALALVESVAAVDDRTVEVAMSAPWSTFPLTLTAQVGYVAAPSMLADPDGGRNPVGTGPFAFRSWTPDDELEVVRNPDYWREGQPLLDAITFVVVPDQLTRSQLLETGDLDLVQMTDAALQPYAEADGSDLVAHRGDLAAGVLVVSFNTAAPPFDDVVAREAVVRAIDTDALTDRVAGGFLEPARGPHKAASPFHQDTGYPEPDAERARELARDYEERHGVPLEFTLSLNTSPAALEVAQVAQQMLADAGVTMVLDATDSSTLITRALSGTFQATSWVQFRQPYLELDYVFLHSSGVRPVGEIGLAYTRLEDPALDEALDGVRATDEYLRQLALFGEAEQRLAEQLPMAYLWHQEAGIVADASVRGVGSWTLPDGQPGRSLDGAISPTGQVWVDR